MINRIYTEGFIYSRLELWLEAEEKVATGQSYKIGSRDLRRADLPEIRKEIQFWEGKLKDLENLNRKGGTRRTYRIVPRDI